MTGAEHYAEAERLVERAYQEAVPHAITVAQAHATLALAAATVHGPGNLLNSDGGGYGHPGRAVTS